MVELLIAAAIVVVGSALCSGSEAALFSIPLVKVQQLAEAHRPGAHILLQIRSNMSRPIATIVILNNIFNIVGSIVVGGMASEVLGDRMIGVFSALLTMAVIIGAEIIPKTIGERYAEAISLIIAAPIRGLTAVLFPVVWVIERIVSPFTKGKIRPVTNEAEIKLLANIGQREGTIEMDEAALIQRVFRLNDLNAGMVMTPRVSVTYVHGDIPLSTAKDCIVASPHSRILVIGESIDDVLGIVLKHEALVAFIEGRGEQPITDITREVVSVPKVTKADKLLTMFQDKREHLAVVLDEFGGVAGVVTLEDVLEVLTGEIVDETDLVINLQEYARQCQLSLHLEQQSHQKQKK